MKRLELILLAGLLGAILYANVSSVSQTVDRLQADVLRLHILANSDSEEDQTLKLAVRDRLLSCSEEIFGDAETMEEVRERGEAVLLPLDAYFAAYPAYRVPSTGKEARVRNGNPITDSRVADGTYRVYGADGAFLCLSQAKGGCLTAIKNFFGT